MSAGTFRVERPKVPEFHLMAVLVPFSAKFTDMAAGVVRCLSKALAASASLAATPTPAV